MSNSYNKLNAHSILVADTGDFHVIQETKPQDATTNPSHILKVATNPEFANLIDEAVTYAKGLNDPANIVDNAADKVCVNFGVEILKRIPGRVSSEVDARLSFNKDAMIAKALKLINLYNAAGVHKDRILIKIASTWEGIQAAEYLQKNYGINCNLTLMFSMAQAIACAQSQVKLISPFVGRVNDWHKANFDADYTNCEDTSPGVEFVKNIYHYYKKHGYKTEIMGASFRNVEQCYALCGCDLMTVWPKYLQEMKEENREVPVILSEEIVKSTNPPRYPNVIPLSESDFRYLHNEDRMAVEQVSNGIRLFAVDSGKLDDLIRARL